MGCAQLSYFLGKMFSCFPFFGSVPDCATCEKFQITEPVYSFFGSWGCCAPYNFDGALDELVQERKKFSSRNWCTALVFHGKDSFSIPQFLAVFRILRRKGLRSRNLFIHVRAAVEWGRN